MIFYLVDLDGSSPPMLRFVPVHGGPTVLARPEDAPGIVVGWVGQDKDDAPLLEFERRWPHMLGRIKEWR